MKVLLFILSLFFATSILAAQPTATLSGQVTADGQLIEFAEALLLNPNDGTLVAHTIINEGVFNFPPLPSVNYQLRIIALGYLDEESNIDLRADKEVFIELKPDMAFQLDEVIVTEKRQRFTNEGGNLRMNVAHTSLSAIPTALDLLNKLPGVLLSADRQSVTIIGQGSPLIYLNNQQISLAEYSALPVDDIEDIELINNPSARYEANGRVVLLVRLKKLRREGYRIELSEIFARKQGYNNYVTANANWNKRKLTGKINLGYHQLQPWEQVISSFSLVSQNFSSDYQTTVLGQRVVYLLGGGFSYQLQSDQSFSVQFNGRFRRGRGDITTYSNQRQDDLLMDINTLSDQLDHRNFLSTRFNYDKSWGKSKLYFGGQHLYSQRRMDADIANRSGGGPLLAAQIRNQLFDVNLYAARLDYEYDFTDTWKLELGLNTSATNSSTNQEITDFVEEPAETNNSRFCLRENNFAAYTQLSGPLRKFRWGLGLRAEQTDTEGRLKQELGPEIDRNRLFLFPNASLSVPFDSTAQLTFNYRRSIQRPAFTNLSQIAFYVNPFTVIQENTALLPSLQDNLSLVLQQKQKTLRLAYSRRSNPSFFVTIYDEEEERYVLTRRNFSQANTFLLNVTIPLEKKRWSSVNSMSLITTNTLDETSLRQTPSPYIHFYTNQEFSLSKAVSLSLRAWGMTKRKEGAFNRNALFTADLVASLTMKEAVRITLSFNDIFNGYFFENEATVQSIASLQRFNVDSREVSLSVRYTLGKSKADLRSREVFEEGGRVN